MTHDHDTPEGTPDGREGQVSELAPEGDGVTGADGRGLFTSEGFVVLAGSRGPREIAPSIAATSDGRMRDPLFEAGVLKVDGDSVVFVRDHLFT